MLCVEVKFDKQFNALGQGIRVAVGNNVCTTARVLYVDNIFFSVFTL